MCGSELDSDAAGGSRMLERCAIVVVISLTLCLAWVAEPRVASAVEDSGRIEQPAHTGAKSTAGSVRHSIPLRSDRRFAYDAGIADGLWIQSRFEYLENDYSINGSGVDVDVDLEQFTFTQRVARGFGNFEIGASLPVIDRDVTLTNRNSGPVNIGVSNGPSATGVGDLHLDAKGVWELATLASMFEVSAGGGLGVLVPTASKDELGSEDPHFDGFATVGVRVKNFRIQSHAGFTARTGEDVVFYGAGVFASVHPDVAVRTEMVGSHVVDAEFVDSDSISISSGVDVKVATYRDIDFIVRATGDAGVTDVAPDWAAGGSIVIRFDPFE